MQNDVPALGQSALDLRFDRPIDRLCRQERASRVANRRVLDMNVVDLEPFKPIAGRDFCAGRRPS